MSVPARRDLMWKLELERRLRKQLGRINSKIIARIIDVFATSGQTADVSFVKQELEQVLKAHYDTTGQRFSKQITEQLPADIAATAQETSTIQQALGTYYVAHAAAQSRIIDDTNQRNANDAATAARESTDKDGKPMQRRDAARVAGIEAARKLRAREQSIATTETQHAAEVAKATEAEVLSKRRPSILAAEAAVASVPKEWVTVGDERVRDAHVAADSQVRDLASPFEVGGQLLRYPGDMSLGATAENVMNCRCSSVYDAQAVFAVRRRAGTPPVIETTPSEQLLVSMGAP